MSTSLRRHPGKKVREIVILGAGGNSIAIVDAIEALNAGTRSPRYRLLGFLDDLPENEGRTVMGYPVLGPIDQAARWSGCGFINGIASTESFRLKSKVIERSGIPDESFETIVHPRAVVAVDAKIGRGCAILANSVLCPGVSMGNHVIMLQNSSVNHHSTVADFATISAGVTILGCVSVGTGAFVGGGSAIAPYVKIGEGALVGMGATVIRNVAPGTVVVGNPARELPASRFKSAGPV